MILAARRTSRYADLAAGLSAAGNLAMLSGNNSEEKRYILSVELLKCCDVAFRDNERRY